MLMKSGLMAREVRLDLSFVPSQFKEEALNFKVSIGGK